MDVSSAVDFSQRLMEALETSRSSRGEGLVSSDRSPVPREVAEAFRTLVEQGPEDAQRIDGTARIQASDPSQRISQTDAVWTSGKAGAPQSVGGSDLAADAPQSSKAPDLPSPEQLLKLQFRMNMQVFESKFLGNVRDSASSQFEQTLKSNS